MVVSTLRDEPFEGVVTVVIDHPPVNAMNGAVAGQLIEALTALAGSADVRAVVITGAGIRAFMAGADINELRDWFDQDIVNERIAQSRRAIHLAASVPFPTIAAIEGFCFGGGFELALACDLRVAGHSAQFAVPEVKLGLLPGGGGTQRLPRLMGIGLAKELLFLGDAITADQAHRTGLVNVVAADGEALTTAQDLAKRIASRPSTAVRLIKLAVGNGLSGSMDAGLNLEAELFTRLCETPDAREGITAFAEKRKPAFRNS